MPKYIRKRTIVNAIRRGMHDGVMQAPDWDEETPTATYEVVPASDYMIIRQLGRPALSCYRGDWLVTIQGHLEVLTDDEFHENYELLLENVQPPEDEEAPP